MATKSFAKISDRAIQKATGNNWRQWFAILDNADMGQKSHREIDQWLQENHIKNKWWSQEVVVGYEQARGIRKPGQGPDGSYAVSISKVIDFPVSELYELFIDPSARQKWLGKDASLEITTARKDKSIRGKWIKGTTISVNFYQKTPGKSQIVVEIKRLQTQSDIEKIRGCWKKLLAQVS